LNISVAEPAAMPVETLKSKSAVARLALVGLFGLFSLFGLFACEGGSSGLTREQYRNAATSLFQQQLYAEAIAYYDAYLKSPALAAEDAPKVLYQMAVIAQDHLRDCEAALARLTVLKALYPDATFEGQVGKRMVNCLETVGRSADAKSAMSRLTDMNAPQAGDAISGQVSASGNDIVADLEGRKITLGEVAEAFGKLPDDPRGRYEAVRTYVAQILVAQAARRKGVNGDAKLKLKLAHIEDQLLASEMIRQEVKLPAPTENDLKYYFEGNKARYASGPDSGKTFFELKGKLAEQIAADWQREKASELTSAYVENLLRTAQVNFYTPQHAGKP
jgi:hypothetical protein